MNKNTQYLFYILLLISIAITARISLYYLTKENTTDTVSDYSVSQTPDIKKQNTKPLKPFKSYQTPENKKTSIVDRAKSPVPLSTAEKNIILKEFGIKKGQTITLSESERMAINKALNR